MEYVLFFMHMSLSKPIASSLEGNQGLISFQMFCNSSPDLSTRWISSIFKCPILWSHNTKQFSVARFGDLLRIWLLVNFGCFFGYLEKFGYYPVLKQFKIGFYLIPLCVDIDIFQTSANRGPHSTLVDEARLSPRPSRSLVINANLAILAVTCVFYWSPGVSLGH